MKRRYALGLMAATTRSLQLALTKTRFGGRLDRGRIVHNGPSKAMLDNPSILENHMGVAGAAAH